MTPLTSHSLSQEIFGRITWFVKGNRGLPAGLLAGLPAGLPAGDLVFDTNK